MARLRFPLGGGTLDPEIKKMLELERRGDHIGAMRNGMNISLRVLSIVALMVAAVMSGVFAPEASAGLSQHDMMPEMAMVQMDHGDHGDMECCDEDAACDVECMTACLSVCSASNLALSALATATSLRADPAYFSASAVNPDSLHPTIFAPPPRA